MARGYTKENANLTVAGSIERSASGGWSLRRTAAIGPFIVAELTLHFKDFEAARELVSSIAEPLDWDAEIMRQMGAMAEDTSEFEAPEEPEDIRTRIIKYARGKSSLRVVGGAAQ